MSYCFTGCFTGSLSSFHTTLKWPVMGFRDIVIVRGYKMCSVSNTSLSLSSSLMWPKAGDTYS